MQASDLEEEGITTHSDLEICVNFCVKLKRRQDVDFRPDAVATSNEGLHSA